MLLGRFYSASLQAESTSPNILALAFSKLPDFLSSYMAYLISSLSVVFFFKIYMSLSFDYLGESEFKK